MKKYSTILYAFVLVIQGTLTCFSQSRDSSKMKVIQILENEKWWGGATLDGRNMPFSEGLIYNQNNNCKSNQAAPLFLSDKGRYIWSEEPLNITISKNNIVVTVDSGKIVSGKNNSVPAITEKSGESLNS